VIAITLLLCQTNKLDIKHENSVAILYHTEAEIVGHQEEATSAAKDKRDKAHIAYAGRLSND
jgi:hypothetical protein